MIFWFRKIAFHHKIINKTRSTKNQENSAHGFGDNYLITISKNFGEIGLNPEELELLESALVITFFNENR